MTLSGSQSTTLTTDADGDYAFTALPAGGTYTVTPSAATFSFSPPAQTFPNLQANQVASFFVAQIGTFRRYFAEGATGTFFDTSIALLNATGQPATATVRFQREDGQVFSQTVQMAGLARATVDPETLAGLEAASFSTVVESTQPIIADRTMRWDGSGYGSHAETSVAQPLTTWYLAEGATTGGFNLFYLLQNPTAQAADGRRSSTCGRRRPRRSRRPTRRREHPPQHLRQRRGPGARRGRDLGGRHVDERGADHRRARDVPRTATASCSAPATRAPRSPTCRRRGSSPKAPPARSSTCSSWSPTRTRPTRRSKLRYLLPSGQVITRTHVARAHSRLTIGVHDEALALARTPVSTTLQSTNGVAVLAERAMWWPSVALVPQWQEGHNSAGAVRTGEKWGLADGEEGGASDHQTYVLVANTSATPGSVQVTVIFEDGTTAQLPSPLSLAANSRTTLPIAPDLPDGASAAASAPSSRASARARRRSSSSGRCTATR